MPREPIPNGAVPPVEVPTACPPEPRRPVPAHPRPQPRKRDSGSVLGFLKHLLPGNFDTADLLVVLLLLLMSGDCTEDPNTALLTLVLYLFL